MYQLDFDQVAEAGFRTKHRPTFPVAQLNDQQRRAAIVQDYQRYHHGGWHLPLLQAHVRSWLKRQVFTAPPLVVVGGVEVSCGKEVSHA